MKAAIFVLSAENNYKLQSNGTTKLTPYPDFMENGTPRNTHFSVTFHVSNTKFNTLPRKIR